ncbi:hypothetical protein [Bradyrhizobium erythrophlei]|uniref:hypothetical protein n=1 Tax=Bradyrhizobium erythrophlei TaxID=1437360 RepID=UPI0012ABDC25|nr:hypothetical protein [Bradyrhizobium erythrophlei]
MEPAIECFGHPIVAFAGRGYGQNPAFPRFRPHLRPRLSRNCAPARLDRASSIPCQIVETPMTLFVNHAAEQTSPMRRLFDGRTERHGEKFFVDHNAASGLVEPDNLFRLLEQYRIEATLMRTQSAATKLLDHIDGWQRARSSSLRRHYLRQTRSACARERKRRSNPRLLCKDGLLRWRSL